MDNGFWQNKKVFITGHTGFKGGWLSLCLYKLGAKLSGYSLNPMTEPSFFDACCLSEIFISDSRSDVRDYKALELDLHQSDAQIVFHLAAQPLVRESYHSPVDTFGTNLMGTVNLLEAVRKSNTVKSIVIVTTDKCYENKELGKPFSENDPMGGEDPYSSSKACVELATKAYRHSFLANSNILVASARAGNVIGGGDWSTDRLIPDFLRSLEANQQLIVRSPNAVRPWQHVLEPISGYMKLAEKLHDAGPEFADAWNFGPEEEDSREVAWLADQMCKNFETASWKTATSKDTLKEAGVLRLDSSKSKKLLNWRPRWDLGAALENTMKWHAAFRNGENMREYSLNQILSYPSTS